MASQFIGLRMRVVLREPPGYQLIGVVRDVEAGSSLTLTNGPYSSGETKPMTNLLTLSF